MGQAAAQGAKGECQPSPKGVQALALLAVLSAPPLVYSPCLLSTPSLVSHTLNVTLETLHDRERPAKRQRTDGDDARIDPKYKFVRFTLFKENRDTMGAISELCRYAPLRLSPSFPPISLFCLCSFSALSLSLSL